VERNGEVSPQAQANSRCHDICFVRRIVVSDWRRDKWPFRRRPVEAFELEEWAFESRRRHPTSSGLGALLSAFCIRRQGIGPHSSSRSGHLPAHDVGAGAIASWASATGLDAVVWTALPPKFDGINGAVPKDAATVLAYLKGLEGEPLERAREYVTRAPTEVRTPFRSAIEEGLGWAPEEALVADGAANAQT